MDLGRMIREHVRQAVDQARRTQPLGFVNGRSTRMNVAAASNGGRSPHTMTVYSDDDVTIIQRDGHREVIRHRPESRTA